MIFAVIVGLISVAPEAITIFSLGKNYQSIPFFKVNDNLFYLAKIQDILEGHWRANSPALYEYKNSTSLILPIGEYLYALPAKLFNLRVDLILVFYKFLLPAALFILSYILVINLSKNSDNFGDKINAVATSLFIALGNDLVNLKNSWLLVTGQMHSFITLGWTRPVNPIIGGILLFIFLLLVWKIINRGRWQIAFIAGIILALMLYYFFSWALGVIVISLLAFIYLLKKNYKIFANLSIIILISFVSSLFYWRNILMTIVSGQGQELAVRSGLLYFHSPLFNKVLLLSLLIFLPCFVYEFIVNKRQNISLDNWWWFCSALLSGGLVALNQQIITGRTVWPYHFTQYTVPFAIIALMLLFNNFIKPKLYWLWQAAVTLIIVFSLAYGIASGRSAIYEGKVMKNLQNYGAVMSWLNTNALKDCVVLTIDKEDDAPRTLEQLIPAVSHCNVYTTGWLHLGPTPPDRILHNYLVMLKLKGIGGNNIDNYLLTHQDEVRGYFFKDMSMANAAVYEKNDPYILEKINYVSGAYKEFIKKDFTQELKKYRLDYIATAEELSAANKKLLPQIKFIGEFNGVYLYEF